MQAERTQSAVAETLWLRAIEALREADEPFALTDATRSRSTSRRKSAWKRGYESGVVNTLCEALYRLGWRDARTPQEVYQWLMREARP